jgi:hypothetical protein
MATSISNNLGSIYSPSTPLSPAKGAPPAPTLVELASQCDDGFEGPKAVRCAVDRLVQWAKSVGDTIEPEELESARRIFLALPQTDRAKVVAKLEQLDKSAAINQLSPKKATLTDQVLQFAKSVYGNWAAASLINGSVAASSTLGIAALLGRGLCCPGVALTMGLVTGAATLGTALKRNLVSE